MSDHSPVLYSILAATLRKANPSGLPSNLVLQNFAMPQDPVGVADALDAAMVGQGYGYTGGQGIPVSGAGSVSATIPLGAAWVLRTTAQVPPGASVGLSVAVGTGSAVAYPAVDPAVVLQTADLWHWDPVPDLGVYPYVFGGSATCRVLGPSATAIPPGVWMLRRVLWIPQSGTYALTTFSGPSGSAQATWRVDGALWLADVGYQVASGQVALTAGPHLLTVTGLTTGSAAATPYVVASIQNAQGAVVEDGSYSPALGTTWETAGIVSPGWGPVSTLADGGDQWAVVPASAITSDQATITVSVTGSPTVDGVWAVSVAPWRWDAGGRYDTARATVADSVTLWPMISRPIPAQTDPRQTLTVIG